MTHSRQLWTGNRLLGTLFFTVLCCGCASSTSFAQPYALGRNVFGSPLSVSIEPSIYAGAIKSLTFRGMQYVDNFDHGRQIQSALQVDNLGECYNPTEAGSRADGHKRSTSSHLIGMSNDGKVLKTETRSAFWLNPGEDYGRPCTPYRAVSRAQNTSILSQYEIERTVRFVGDSNPNMLSIDVRIHVPEKRFTASVEALTGYLPAKFKQFYDYDPRTRHLRRLDATPRGAQTWRPVIVATEDGKHAMGVISPQITARRQTFDAYYAYFYFPDGGATAKWSCVFGPKAISAGSTLAYSCPIAVGTLKEVMTALSAYAGQRRL